MNGPEWLSQLRQYEGADVKKSIIQIITSFVPYLALMTTMFLMYNYGYPYWIVLLLSLIASFFLVRIFIILHDCSHNSYFDSPRACSLVGHICGILTFSSPSDFRHTHGTHHATVANLEKRGTGDIWTMTVDEYRSAGRWKRFVYRVSRNPFVVFGIGSFILFLLWNRIPPKNAQKKVFFSIIFIDIIIALTIVAAFFTVGIKSYLAVQLPVLCMAASMGVWLFFVQHQFEDVYWSHNEDWDPFKAAMKGCSFYNLPGPLRWFSGSIGYHHVHHLRPRIPNYNLKKCYSDISGLQEIKPISLWKGFRSVFLHLWDEKTGKLVSFSRAKKIYSSGGMSPTL